MARPHEAVGCRTLICWKADSGQLNDLAITLPSGFAEPERCPTDVLGFTVVSASPEVETAEGRFSH
jgi:hypothetical protein